MTIEARIAEYKEKLRKETNPIMKKLYEINLDLLNKLKNASQCVDGKL